MPDGDVGDTNLWILGAIFGILASTMSTLGVNIQKYMFKRRQRDDIDGTVYWRQPLWVLGFSLIVSGSILDFSALGFAAQSIVAPIGSVTLVANVIFARIWLEEALSKRDIFGTMLILVGSITAVIWGNHDEAIYSLDELLHLYKGCLFLAYLGAYGGGILLLLVVVVKCETLMRTIVARRVQLSDADARREPALAASLTDDIGNLGLAYNQFVKWHPFCLCSLSGMLGALSILFAKCIAVLLRRTGTGDNQFGKPFTYVFFVACAATILGQIHFLAMALQRFDALYVVPVFQCAFISVSTLGGMSLFKEFATFDVVQTILFPTGLLITLTGVYILSMRTMSLTTREPQEQQRLASYHKSMEEITAEMNTMTPLIPLLGTAWGLNAPTSTPKPQEIPQ